ncbi:unnamed protein product [Ambrosiozyma monospora]|uniref:Unnamed protein product n=1 Tax=Ambrosiozyma monospora TaxID=43982 RepID=A0A9W6YXQ3_AMBMO|nr:unnamed protein product [Ambrosiozyma monospora]
MFGYKYFQNNGEDNFTTPKEFQDKAREDIKHHLESVNKDDARFAKLLKYQQNLDNRQQPSHSQRNKTKNKVGSSLFKRNNLKVGSKLNPFHRQQQQPEQSKQVLAAANAVAKASPTSQLTYGSSPLRKTITISSNDSSDASSIESDHSSHSINSGNMTIISNGTLNRSVISSTFEHSIFSNQLSAIYTNTTMPSSVPSAFMNNVNQSLNGSDASMNTVRITLNDALPKDFTNYYSPDLNVPRFSNNRPRFTRRNLKNWEINDVRSLLIYPSIKSEWSNNNNNNNNNNNSVNTDTDIEMCNTNSKTLAPAPPPVITVPEIISPYPHLQFRIQILPLESTDLQYVEFLAQSDIYKESKFDYAFKYNTAMYIVQQARIRHQQMLSVNFGAQEEQFNSEGLCGLKKFDCFDLCEWRNIIENYLLNLGIENQCRIEFKNRIEKLECCTNEKLGGGGAGGFGSGGKKRRSDDLYRKVLIKDKVVINDELKTKVWQDVQKFVYQNIEI